MAPFHSNFPPHRIAHSLIDEATGRIITTAQFAPEYCERANAVNVAQGLPNLQWQPSYKARHIAEVITELKQEYWWEKI